MNQVSKVSVPNKEPRLDLDLALEKGWAVWVLNNTKPKGRVTVTFSDNTGYRQPFVVEKTWIPFNVSEIIPTDVIKQSMDFRRHLRKGVLKLITPEKAEEILKDNMAEDERERLFTSIYSANSTANSERVQNLVEVQRTAYGEQEQMQTRVVAEINDEQMKSGNLTPSVLDICNRFNGQSLQAREALNELKCIDEEITEQDCQYIITNCDGQVRNWAKTKLQHLLADQES